MPIVPNPTHRQARPPGIPTAYAGQDFRSRLEAKWAAMFDILGWQWTYEPFDGTGYVPDFLISSPHPMLIEVKPAVTEADYLAPVQKITAGIGYLWTHDVLIVGADAQSPHGTGTAGLFVDFLHDHTDWNTTPARWMLCSECVTLGITPDGQDGLLRPCGHTATAHQRVNPAVIVGAWRQAGNIVKWKPAA